MRRRVRPVLAWVWMLCVIAAAAGGCWYIVSGGPAAGRVDRASVAGTLWGFVAVVPPAVAWARSWARGGSASQQADHAGAVVLDAATDALAAGLWQTWRTEANRRGILAPAPARVLWQWADGDVTVSREELNASPRLPTDPLPLARRPDAGSDTDTDTETGVGAGCGLGAGPDSPVLAAGLVSHLHDEVYARLRHGRLVLLGEAGAGKTGAMILLLLEALQYRGLVAPDQRAAVPVPALLTLGQWDPQRQSLREWVTTTVARDHQYRNSDAGPDVIGRLLDAGRLALFLDGFDEMPAARRATAMERLATEVAPLRIVLTSRVEAYREVAEQGRALGYTAVLRLRPVGPQAAIDYLLAGHTGSARDRWRPVIDRLQTGPDAVLARTLNSPLTLSLARSAYEGADPAPLLAADLDTQSALRGHLLDRALVRAYPDPKERAHALYWLGWIADRMTHAPGGPVRELAWWKIPGWVPRREVQRGSMIVLGPMILPISLLAGVLAGSAALGLAIGGLFILAVGAAAGGQDTVPRVMIPRLPTGGDVRRRASVFVGPLLFGLVGGTSAGLIVGLSSGLLAGLLTGLVTGPVLSTMTGYSRVLDDLWVQPADTVVDATPLSIYRDDVLTQAARGGAGALAGMLLGIFGGYLGFMLGLLWGGLTGGLLRGASSSLLLAEMALWVSGPHGGRRRMRFLPLLETALQRQVLRQAGAVYEFRHADLQDRLADAHPAASLAQSSERRRA